MMIVSMRKMLGMLQVYVLYILKIQMCTNSALVDTLECYMDNLVCCFEDFVKKSLILITVGIATVVFILLYMLKIIAGRTDTPINAASASSLERRHSHGATRSLTSCCPKSCLEQSSHQNSYPKINHKPSTTTCTSATSRPASLFGKASNSSCKRNCCEAKKKTSHKSSACRLPIPSLSTCMIKQHVSPRPPTRNHSKTFDTTSCCSMCCDDKSLNTK